MNTDFSIEIKGSHYFGCDYIFSNIYGSAVFTENDCPDDGIYDIPMNELISDDPNKGDFSEKTLERFIDDASDLLDISTLPDCSKEIEYSTRGTLSPDGSGGVYIRYSGDFSPICMHVSKCGKVTLNGEDDDFSELVFETGKRNYLALPESLFGETCPSLSRAEPDENCEDRQSPLQLCINTRNIDADMTEDGGSLKLSYSIEVNGITAESSDIVLTANPQNTDELKERKQ